MKKVLQLIFMFSLLIPSMCFKKTDSLGVTNSLTVKDYMKTFLNLTFSEDKPIWLNVLHTALFMYLYSAYFNKLWLQASRTKIYQRSTLILELVTKTVNGASLCLLLLPVILPIYIILWSVAKCVELRVRSKYGNKVVRSRGLDIVWGSISDVSTPFITVALRYEGRPEMNLIRETCMNKVLNFTSSDGSRPFRRLQQTFDFYYGYFFWRDCDNFTLDNHLKIVNISDLYPDLNDMDEILWRYASDKASHSFLKDQPQWEVNFLTGKNDKEFTAFVKIHHAIGDGLSLIRLLLEQLGDNPVKLPLLQPPQHPLIKFIYALWSISYAPFAMKYIFRRSARNPLHGTELTGEKIRVTSERIPLDIIKKIKNKADATVTDVLISCLSDAVSSFFEKRSSSIENITIFAPIGFEDATSPIAMKNNFTIVMTRIPTIPDSKFCSRVEDNNTGPAVKRLQEIQKNLNEMKRGPVVLSMFYITTIFVEVLPSIISNILFTTSGLTLSVSNIPGPQDDIFTMKNKLHDMLFWVPDRAPNGSGFSIISYKGQIRVGFTVDKAFINSREEAQQVVNAFSTALQKLAQELGLN